MYEIHNIRPYFLSVQSEPALHAFRASFFPNFLYLAGKYQTPRKEASVADLKG